MPPKVQKEGADGINHPDTQAPAPAFDWAEFRDMMITSQTNIQAYLQQLNQTLIRNTADHNPQRAVAREVGAANQLAPAHHQERDLANFRPHEHKFQDTRWEAGFKVDIPEFHGGISGDALLDWLVAV